MIDDAIPDDTLNIFEVRKLRDEATEQIRAVIAEFEGKTGCVIKGIHLHRSKPTTMSVDMVMLDVALGQWG